MAPLASVSGVALILRGLALVERAMLAGAPEDWVVAPWPRPHWGVLAFALWPALGFLQVADSCEWLKPCVSQKFLQEPFTPLNVGSFFLFCGFRSFLSASRCALNASATACLMSSCVLMEAAADPVEWEEEDE